MQFWKTKVKILKFKRSYNRYKTIISFFPSVWTKARSWWQNFEKNLQQKTKKKSKTVFKVQPIRRQCKTNWLSFENSLYENKAYASFETKSHIYLLLKLLNNFRKIHRHVSELNHVQGRVSGPGRGTFSGAGFLSHQKLQNSLV